MKLSESQTTRTVFYQKLGKLFYAVAMADKVVHIDELEKLKQLVRANWLQIDDVKDEYGKDAAFQIEIVFDWLLEYEKDGESCFKEFETYYKYQEKYFSAEIKKLIFSTASAIAHAFANKNKSELILLAKIKLLFDQES